MPINLLNTASATSGSTTGTSISVTYSPVTNNPVVLGLSLSNGSGGSVTCKDNNSNALTVAATSGSTIGYIAYGLAVSGATSYKWSWTTTRTNSIVLAEFSGCAASPFGNVYSGNSASSINPTITPAVQSKSNSICVGVVSSAANSSYSTSTATVAVQASGGAGNQNSCAIGYSSSVTAGNFNWTLTIGSATWRTAGIELLAGTSTSDAFLLLGVG